MLELCDVEQTRLLSRLCVSFTVDGDLKNNLSRKSSFQLDEKEFPTGLYVVADGNLWKVETFQEHNL